MRLFISMLVLLCATPARAAVTYINSSSAASATGSALSGAASMDTTGANFIACAVSDYNANSPSTIQESRGPSFATGYTTNTSTSIVQVRLAYWVNPSTGNPTAFSTSAGTTYVAIACVALAGVDTTAPFEAESSGGAAASVNVQPGSLTPAVDNEVLITVLGVNIDTSETINGGYGVNGGAPKTGGALVGTAFSASIAYLIQTSKTAANPTWTGTDTTGRAARQATFLSSSGGGGGTFTKLALTGSGK